MMGTFLPVADVDDVVEDVADVVTVVVAAAVAGLVVGGRECSPDRRPVIRTGFWLS
jgi:hypothetical protein